MLLIEGCKNPMIQKPIRENEEKYSQSLNAGNLHMDKDSIISLLHSETKVDSMNEVRDVFLDCKIQSKYKHEYYKIANEPLSQRWSKDVFRPQKSYDSAFIVNPYKNLNKTYISISKLKGSYILFSQGQESLAYTVYFIGDTTLTYLNMQGWYVSHYRKFDFKNNRYVIECQSPFSTSMIIEIKIIDKSNDIQIWKTTFINSDERKVVKYDLKAPVNYALHLPILVISNSLGLDVDYDGIDKLNLEELFNK